MKLFFMVVVMSFGLSALAESKCPAGYEEARGGTKIKKLNKDYILVLNNSEAVVGDDTAEGSFTVARHGLVRLNYHERLKRGDTIEPNAQIKLVGHLPSWDAAQCGLLTSLCMLVDHPHVRSIQIDSSKDTKIKDLRASGIEICKSIGTNLANKKVVDSDRAVTVEKDQSQSEKKSKMQKASQQ